MPRAAIVTQQNLYKQSQAFSNAAWTKNTGVTATDNTSDVTDPLGINTASKIVYDGSGTVNTVKLQQAGVGPTIEIGTQNTMSIWARTLSGTATIRLGDNGTQSGPMTVTSTWQQFTYSPIATIRHGLIFNTYQASADNSPFTIYVWQAQGVLANWAGPYTLTTGAVVNTGPIRNAVASRSAVNNRATIKTQQNLVLRSADISNASWSKTRCTVSGVNGIIGTAVLNSHFISQSVTSVVNGVYTMSCSAKQGAQGWMALSFSTGGNGWFNLTNGTLGSKTAAAYSIKVDPNNPGYYICTITSLPVTTTAEIFEIFASPANSTTNYTGDGATVDTFVTQMQWIQGNWAGPYTATAGSAVNTGPIRNLVANT